MGMENVTDLGEVRALLSGVPGSTDVVPVEMEDDDGSIEIEIEYEDGDGAEEELLPPEPEHGDNLAVFIAQLENGEAMLDEFGQQLIENIGVDKDTRSDWEDVFKDGLKLMGIKGSNTGDLDSDVEEELFKGASALYHPLITEACVQFQAESLKAMLPPSGPAGTRVVGDETPEKMEQASRVKNYLNYQATDQIKGYFEEHDKLLMYLGKAGSAFKKVMFNQTSNRIEVTYLPGEDVIIPYNARSMADAERISHIERDISMNTLAHRIANGRYRDVPVQAASDEQSEVKETLDAQQGITKGLPDQDTYTVYCVLVDTVIPGFEIDRGGLSAPYIVHVEETGKVLGIYRNWREGDPVYERRDYFVHYCLVQSDGFYGYGFIHLLGQLARGASAALRQLLDAGTLSNLQGGFKRKGTRIANDGEGFEPGEFRDVETISERISDAIMPLKFNEPSNVLYQLMGFLVDAGRRMVSLTDLNVGDGNQEAPVGTTIALLERGMNVMSAVHMRLCRAQKEELKIIARLCSEHLPEEYPYDVPGQSRKVFKADFDDRVDVLPICDPRQFSQAQRIARAQNKLQLAQQFPNRMNQTEALRDMMREIDDSNIDRIIPPEQEMEPTDPMQENMDLVTGKPVKAFLEQNHEAHIKAHMAQLQNPSYQDNGQMKAAAMAHIQEHMAFDYKVKIMQTLGIKDPEQLKQIPPEQLAVAVATATEQVTGQAQALAEAEARAAEPTFEQRMLEAEMQNDAAEIQRKSAADQREFLVNTAKVKQDDRDAEMRAVAGLAKVLQDGQAKDVSNVVSLLSALQNANQKEQTRDKTTSIM